MAGDEYVVRDNPEQSRYELLRDGELVGELLYRLLPDTIVLVHTEVVPEARGQGLAGRLVAGALEDIRSRALRYSPVCPFVVAYLRKHPEAR